MSFLAIAKKITAELTDAPSATVLSPLPSSPHLKIADAAALLGEYAVTIRAAYLPGALAWAQAEAPDLLAAVTAAEDVLDRLAGTRPTEASFRAACDRLTAAWFDLLGRFAAHTEAAGCP